MALTNAEKQAAWRARREQRIQELEELVAKLQRENTRLRREVRKLKEGAGEAS